jgi:hypothetical protein
MPAPGRSRSARRSSTSTATGAGCAPDRQRRSRAARSGCRRTAGLRGAWFSGPLVRPRRGGWWTRRDARGATRRTDYKRDEQRDSHVSARSPPPSTPPSPRAAACQVPST